MKNYLLNTIAFNDSLQQGVSQAQLVEKVARLGFETIEIRNEFLQDPQSELPMIAQKAQAIELKTSYSVNDVLFTDKGLNPQLPKYIAEMKLLNAKRLKLNIGKFQRISTDIWLTALVKLLDDTFELVVENNQTFSESNLALTCEFFEIIQREKLKITYCFDIANWYWLETTPMQAAEKLASLTTYLHLKNVVRTQDGLTTVSLFEGEIDVLALLKQFPHVTNYGLEYFASPTTLQSDLKKIKEND